MSILREDMAALGVFEINIQRAIFVPLCVGDDFDIRMNMNLFKLLTDRNIV